MQNFLQTLIGILFFVGLFSGFIGVADLKYALVSEHYILYGYAGVLAFLGSFFTPFIIRYTHKTGFLGYLQEVFNHFLLNISVLGANGLFLFLLINAWNVETCEKANYTVLDWKNTVHKMKYSNEYEAWVLLKSQKGDSLLLRFEDHLPNAPKSADLCLAKGNFGLWLLKERVINY